MRRLTAHRPCPLALGLRAALLPALLLGCAPDKADTGGLDCDPSAAAPGEAQAELNGEPWLGPDAAWSPSGDGVQITTSLGEGYRLTLVAYGVQDAISDGRLPQTLPMDAAGLEAWGLLYPEDGASFSSKAGEGGQLTVFAVEGDLLSGCFDFGAAAGDEALRVSGGRFLAEAL